MNNDKKPAKYSLGDKVLARWVDGRRYPGMIDQILTNGNYIVFFEDGARKSVKPMHIELNLKPIPRLEYPFADPKELAEIHESDLCDYIIKCICESTKDVGILVQCEYCSSWQHATCIGIETNEDLPNAYTCYVCKNPEKVYASRRYCHDSFWLKKGKLPCFSSTEEQSSNNQESKVAAVNLLLDAAMECVWIIHGLKNQISLLEGTKESINLNLCNKPSIKNDESTLLKSSKETKSEEISILKSYLSIKDSSPAKNLTSDKSSASPDQIYLKLPSNSKANVKHNIQVDQIIEDPSKSDCEVADEEIINQKSTSKLSPLDTHVDTPKKKLLEHILGVKSRLENRLSYIEARIDDIEKDYGLNLDPDEIEREEAKFRKTIKLFYRELKLVMDLSRYQKKRQMGQDKQRKELEHKIGNETTKQKDSELS
uniref:PHD-type domain-containing protein n=2 Tax=Tetranychus urticae TaxID=32264 RepID=T1L1C9_TETUR